MQNFGRRYTIEPKRERPASVPTSRPVSPSGPAPLRRPASRAGHTPSGQAITGIRLFPGNALVISKKYGSHREQLLVDIAHHELTFTVTERGFEPEAFVRVMYRCPKSLFVQTVRDDEGEGAAKSVTSGHKAYRFDREVGQTVIIRPRVPAEEAVLDVETYGLFVQPWFEAERGRVCLQVAATEAWEVIRAEQLAPQPSGAVIPVALDKSSKEFLTAFMQASEHYLDREEFDLLKERAWALIKQRNQS
jgi:hypothetical protein